MMQYAALLATIQLAEERGMPEGAVIPELSLAHVRDMLGRVTGDFSDAKLGRWLGWAQCAVVSSGVATLEDMKNINRAYAADEDSA